MYNGVYTIDQFAYSYDTLKKWIQVKTQGNSLGMRMKEAGIEKAFIYGANDIGQMVCADVKSEVEILGYIDRAADKYSNGIDGVPVYSLDAAVDILKDATQKVCHSEMTEMGDNNIKILVTPEFYFCDILEDLTNRGVELRQIISLAMVVG